MTYSLFLGMILTSEREHISDPRVHDLADRIIEAQRDIGNEGAHRVH